MSEDTRVNKKDLVEYLEHKGFAKAKASKAVREMCDWLAIQLHLGNEISLPKLGSIVVKPSHRYPTKVQVKFIPAAHICRVVELEQSHDRRYEWEYVTPEQEEEEEQ